MPYRGSLHSIIDLLADLQAFENHTVAIVVVNGTDVKLSFDPPLHPVIQNEVAIKRSAMSGLALLVNDPDYLPAESLNLSS